MEFKLPLSLPFRLQVILSPQISRFVKAIEKNSQNCFATLPNKILTKLLKELVHNLFCFVQISILPVCYIWTSSNHSR
jgi:hypothetical protein